MTQRIRLDGEPYEKPGPKGDPLVYKRIGLPSWAWAWLDAHASERSVHSTVKRGASRQGLIFDAVKLLVDFYRDNRL